MTDVIRNCTLKYQCPMKWDQFEDTSIEDVKFCTSCKKTVHYCHNAEELRLALIENLCVAFKIYRVDRSGDFEEIAGF